MLRPLILTGLLVLGGCERNERREESPRSSGPEELGWKCGDGRCDRKRGEDCTICEEDCGRCNGCQEMAGPGCPDARCEACVCQKRPACCRPGGRWGKKCVLVCKEQCGGCARKPGLEHISTVTRCKDCDGCKIRRSGGCEGCKCEACVCERLPACCGEKGRWGSECVAACKEKCRGCGVRHSGDEGPRWISGGGKPDGVGCRCHAAED